MNPASTSFVLAYHGCDQQTARDVVAGRAALRPNHNDYDWLGDSIYFWEHNAQRAYEYALELTARPRNHRQKIKHPAVIGAVIGSTKMRALRTRTTSRYASAIYAASRGISTPWTTRANG